MRLVCITFNRFLNFLTSLLIIKDIKKFIKKNDGRFFIKIYNLRPIIFDKTNKTNFDIHYIYHPAWAARILAELKPDEHIDISSSLAFASMISAFIPTKFYDYRPADLFLDNLSSLRADLNSLPFKDNSLKSVSCMHTVEHIGLGRYGDEIDPQGDLKAIHELKRVVAIGGSLLFVVPVGRPMLVFNAHRIYSYEQIISYFKGFKLKNFSLISEKNNKIINQANAQLVAQEKYGCGCFWFIKKY